MKRGFTLMEVCVSLLVLSFGVLGVNYAVRGFNRQVVLEREKVQALLCSVSAMESLVKVPPSCRDTLVTVVPSVEDFSCQRESVRLVPVPGGGRLAYALGPDSLRRMVRCR